MKTKTAAHGGKLRIGDDWNAIRIIALSQSNPLKAVAEFVENSIDAKARHITLTRGKDKGVHFLRIKDDGEGIRRDADGVPDFGYVATHICDSIKRRLKDGGATGIQGEFGGKIPQAWASKVPGLQWAAGATQYSAYAPPGIKPQTSSPTLNCVTLLPIAATVPDVSSPSTGEAPGGGG